MTATEWPEPAEGETFRGVTWTGVKVKRWTVFGSSFTGCRFERVNVAELLVDRGAGKQTVFRDCDFGQCQWRPLGPGGGGAVADVRFENCRFDGGWWKGWIGHGVELVGCTFASSLIDCAFHGSILDEDRRAEWGRDRNRFEGNDFSAATLQDFAFRGGIDVDQQKWHPQDHVLVHDAARRVAAAREVVERDWSGDRRDEAVLDLKRWERWIDMGQQDIVIVRKDVTMPDVLELL